MSKRREQDPHADFVRNFPTKKQVPCTDRVEKLCVENASRVLVNIRQIHYVPDLSEEEESDIAIVQKDIEQILRFFIRDSRTRLEHVYAEGLSFDHLMPGSVNFKMRSPGSALRDLHRELSLSDAIQGIARSSVIRDCVQYFLAQSKYAHVSEKRMRTVMEKRADTYIENLQTIMWSDNDSQHRKDSLLFLKRFKYFVWFVENVVFRVSNVKTWEQIYREGDRALPRYQRIVSGQESAGSFERMILERLAGKWEETKATYEKNAATAVEVYHDIAQWDRHALYKLFSQHQLSLRGAESATLSFMPHKMWSMDTTIVVRDQIQLCLVAEMPDAVAYSVRGCSHNMRAAAQKWNDLHPDKKVSVIEITPKKLPPIEEKLDRAALENKS